jgi:FtsP/CotA-like multicopper oxidase with cupredoxin domain
MDIDPKGSLLGRRRFVEGIAAVAGVSNLAPSRGWAKDRNHTLVELRGSRFDLTIGAMPFNITGRERTATAVNGSVPGPILRLREGDTVTLNVTNRLKAPTSIHWHGILLPNVMDGVPGLAFRGIMPGETFTYRFPVRQAGTY